jgi:hypothetical protein
LAGSPLFAMSTRRMIMLAGAVSVTAEMRKLFPAIAYGTACETGTHPRAVARVPPDSVSAVADSNGGVWIYDSAAGGWILSVANWDQGP